MRPHWIRDHDRDVAAANDRLRQRYQDRRESFETGPIGIPYRLKQAICSPRWSGEPVLVTANGRDVAVVLGTESTDAQAIWRDITAAVQADEDAGTGVRLIPPAPFAEGLRALAVPSEQQVVVWRSSAESVTNRRRRIAARRALRALRGHKIPPAVLLSLLVPGWRKAVPIAAVAIAAVIVAVLISAGQIWQLNRGPSSPPVAVSSQAAVGADHDLARSAPRRGTVGSGPSSPRPAGGAARSQHSGTGTVATASASSAGQSSATQPQPSPTRTSSSPSPSPTKKKVCAFSVLGVCVKWK